MGEVDNPKAFACEPWDDGVAAARDIALLTDGRGCGERLDDLCASSDFEDDACSRY